MSKYDPLTSHLEAQGREMIPMSFREIERILGFDLPASSRRHRAWWSNNPTNNVMTHAWLRAGYSTENVDLDQRRLVFRRDPDRTPPRGGAASQPPKRAENLVGSISHAFHGVMKGTVTVAPGSDLAAPADPDWADEIERDE